MNVEGMKRAIRARAEREVNAALSAWKSERSASMDRLHTALVAGDAFVAEQVSKATSSEMWRYLSSRDVPLAVSAVEERITRELLSELDLVGQLAAEAKGLSVSPEDPATPSAAAQEQGR